MRRDGGTDRAESAVTDCAAWLAHALYDGRGDNNDDNRAVDKTPMGGAEGGSKSINDEIEHFKLIVELSSTIRLLRKQNGTLGEDLEWITKDGTPELKWRWFKMFLFCPCG